MESNKNLVKRKLPYIGTFNHEGPTVVSAMRNLTVGVFDQIEITSPMEGDKMVAHTEHILRGYALKNYRAVMV